MKYAEIRQQTLKANLEIVRAGLVLLTWGNASVRHPEKSLFAIKPSGIAYDDLSAEAMVVVSLESGEVVEGNYNPSSDTPTHLELYRAFAGIGAVVHTHSHFAVVCAQARVPIVLQGTTHADNFRYDIPVTRTMTEAEVTGAYEVETGRVIVERFTSAGLNPLEVPGALVANHGPFAWGADARSAVENAIVLEESARMYYHTATLNPDAGRAPHYLSEKHFLRKHGKDAYYGQR